jgi:hypothetical protein
MLGVDLVGPDRSGLLRLQRCVMHGGQEVAANRFQARRSATGCCRIDAVIAGKG